MNDVLDPPAERDLPPGRAARMRADVLRTVRMPASAPRPRFAPVSPASRRRFAVASAAIAAAAAAVVVIGVQAGGPSPGGGTLVALGPIGLPAGLDEAERLCQNRNGTHPDDRPFPALAPMDRANRVVAVERHRHTILLYATDDAYTSCQVMLDARGSGGMSLGTDHWGPRRDWLPGPVDILDYTSSELDGGDVSVVGRVGERVGRLALEWGDGESVDARVGDGFFGLLTDAGEVTADAELVSYDGAGAEIGRRRLFTPVGLAVEQCYADPAGRVVYTPLPALDGTPAERDDCLPAEPWGR